MLKQVLPDSLLHFAGITLLLFVFVFHDAGFSQIIPIKGIVKNEQNGNPVPGVNIKVYYTNLGTSTDSRGRFSLRLNKIPVTLAITCIGYENAYYDIVVASNEPLEFSLKPKAYNLEEVDISTKKYSFVFKDRDYSVLDYEIMGDNILMLVFRYELKHSEMVMLSRFGDTLAVSKLPEAPPSRLFKDFLGNVHYITKSDNSYQCFPDEEKKSVEFLYKTTVDSITKLLKPFLFELDGRFYFQENTSNGFGSAIGYYDRDHGKKYLRNYFNDQKVQEYNDDQVFYGKWNNFIAGTTSQPMQNFTGGWFYDEYEARAHQLFFWNMIFPVVKTGDDHIAFFDFANDVIEIMDKDGQPVNKVPITFHKKTGPTTGPGGSVILLNAGWWWGNAVITDGYTHEVYTTFHRNGMVRLQRIDLETGQLSAGTELPFPFPEKIEIYKREAFFLIKSDGSTDNWKIVRCKL